MAFAYLATQKFVKSALLVPSSCQKDLVRRATNISPKLWATTRFLSTIKDQKDGDRDHVIKEEDIVIVGGGIAGLAAAVSLQRLGIKSKVLEQAESLRASGISVTLSKNGWAALDAIGLGNQLRPQFLEIQGVNMKTHEGRELASFNFKEADESQELRAVERRILLETLANQLPKEAISCSSKLTGIEKKENGDTLLKLQDGRKISAKVVIACDGVNSPVAKWMGFPQAKYVGHSAIRGLGFFPDGHSFDQRVNYLYGKGIRAAFVPVSTTKVYWGIVYNSSSPGPRITDPSVLRQESKELVSNWSSDLSKIIDVTPDDTIIRNPLVDRWLWPLISPPASNGNIVLVGDAWHPMTPNTGQGACNALVDAVILTKKLAEAMQSETMSIEDAFRSYQNERWRPVFSMTILANLIGRVMQSENPLVYAARNNLLPKLIKHGLSFEKDKS